MMSREEIYDTTLGNETGPPLRFLFKVKSSRMNDIRVLNKVGLLALSCPCQRPFGLKPFASLDLALSAPRTLGHGVRKA